MTTDSADYSRTGNVGFTANLPTIGRASTRVGPRPLMTSINTLGDPNLFSRTLAPEGFAAGVKLAARSLAEGRSVADDLHLLLEEHDRARGQAANHAKARLVGYLWQIDEAFAALRAGGVTVTVPRIDADALVEQLKDGAQ